MNIGFDLDKIFIDTPPLVPKRVIDKLYKKRDNGVLQYRIPNKFDQVLRKFTHIEILRPPIKENMNFLKEISRGKYKLFLISSRFKFLEKQTEKIAQKYGFYKIFEAMYFNYNNEQPHLFKNRIIKKLKLDYYIDDDLSLLKFVEGNNRNTKFFWLNDSSMDNLKTGNIATITKISDIFRKGVGK